MKIKDQSIETLRGAAIILVVAGYIIKGDLVSGVHSHVSSGLDFMYYLLKPIRMPLFTVISAYLYASSPASKNTLAKLIDGKFHRLMIPFFTVSAIQYTFYALVPVKGPHPLHDIYKVYLYPLEQFWFIWSVFWIFIIVGFLDARGWISTPARWLRWMMAAVACHMLIVPTELFSIWGVNYLFPFFLLGYGMRRFNAELFTPFMVKGYIATALAVYPVYTYFYFKWVDGGHYLYLGLALIISLTAVPLLFHFRRTIPFLAGIGYYAFGIHIFNKISSAMPRLLFQHLHITDPALIFTTYLGCGIIFSIGLQMLVERFSLTRQYILGIREKVTLLPDIAEPMPELVLTAEPALAYSQTAELQKQA